MFLKQKLKRISSKLKNCSFRVGNILFYQPECSDTKRGLYEYKLFGELNFNFERSICNLFRARSIIHRHYSSVLYELTYYTFVPVANSIKSYKYLSKNVWSKPGIFRMLAIIYVWKIL